VMLSISTPLSDAYTPNPLNMCIVETKKGPQQAPKGTH
jgi:hypothetical protein